MSGRERITERFGGFPDFDGALAIVRRFGYHEFTGSDGCLCAWCELRGIRIDISCRKSSGSSPKFAPDFYGTVLRLTCSGLDSKIADLIPLADEMVSQIQECAGTLPVWVRFCSYQQDHGIGPTGVPICCYCGKPREGLEAYLCEKCLTGHDAWGDRISDRYTLPESFKSLRPALEETP